MTGEETAIGSTYRIIYTEDVVRDAVRTYVWRRGVVQQKGLWAAELIMLLLLGWLIWRGDQSWLLGVTACVVLLPPFLIVMMWMAHHRNTVGKLRRIRHPVAELTIRADGLDVVSELGAGHISWSNVTEIWEGPRFWMIFMGPNQFNTLPNDVISDRDRAFLRSRAMATMDNGRAP